MPLSPASWPEGGGGGGSDLLQTLTFALTAQEIKDSTLTPVEIIPAQGAGTLIVPTMYVFDFDAGATPFTDAGLSLFYGEQDLNALVNPLTGGDYVGWTSQCISAGFTEGGTPADYLDQPLCFRATNLRGEIVAIYTGDFGLAAADYAPGDTGTIDDGTTLATYEVAAVIAGVPSAVTITSPGDGYNLSAGGAPSQWVTTPGGAQPGIGSGMEITVTSIDAGGSAGDGSLSGVVYYLVTDLS